MRWSVVDLDAPEIRITGTTAVIEGQRIEGTTKSGKSRVVSLDKDTADALREHRKHQQEQRLCLGPTWKGTDDYVFTTGWGEPIYPTTVTSLVPNLIAALNNPKNGPKPKKPLPHARLHDLRHLHATTLLLAGVPVHVVAARLGHADPAITLRVYAHVINEQMASAADIFANAVKNSA
ncbi:tyrosine-type recombinase/integrase [Planotetraspora silvatica]|uniref:tyrosine-type recombinase/integrase n=1 Tax=Planotetraspora silvatica TaxID=234614 RepID=UPI0023B2621F|nr:site-specific integrase [Planotetraspora silvatica]